MGWWLIRSILQEFSLVRFGGDKAKADAVYKGVEPLTPDDIAEVVVFTAGRRENVVIADSLIFPNHQVSNALPHTCARLNHLQGSSDSDAPQIIDGQVCHLSAMTGQACNRDVMLRSAKYDDRSIVIRNQQCCT